MAAAVSRRNPSRGRRTQQRAADRRALREQRQGPPVLQVPDHIRVLADQVVKEAGRG